MTFEVPNIITIISKRPLGTCEWAHKESTYRRADPSSLAASLQSEFYAYKTEQPNAMQCARQLTFGLRFTLNSTNSVACAYEHASQVGPFKLFVNSIKLSIFNAALCQPKYR